MLMRRRIRYGSREDSEITVSIDSGNEGYDFVLHNYGKLFNTIPKPTEYLLVARIDKNIVGTLGIDIENPPFRDLFEFEIHPDDLIGGYCEMGRWISLDREYQHISKLLIHCGSKFAIQNGVYNCCFQISPTGERNLKQSGILSSYPISRALLRDRVRNEDAPFYDSHSLRVRNIACKDVIESTIKYVNKMTRCYEHELPEVLDAVTD